MKSYALLIDYKYCTGCHSCEVACRQEKGLSLDEWGIKLTQFGPDSLNGKWQWNYLPTPSVLCDMCEDRIAAGKKPSCVHHCLAKCIEYVPVDDISATMKAKGDTVVCYIP